MPYEIFIYDDVAAGYVRLTGYVDANDINEAADALAADPRWQRHYGVLWDLSYTDVVDIDPAGLSALIDKKIERETAHDLQGKIAVVVDRPAIGPTFRFWGLRASTPAREMRVFYTAKRACTWLGLSEDITRREPFA